MITVRLHNSMQQMSTVTYKLKRIKGLSLMIQTQRKQKNHSYPKTLPNSSSFFLGPEQQMLKMLSPIKVKSRNRPASNLNKSLSNSSLTKIQTSQTF